VRIAYSRVFDIRINPALENSVEVRRRSRFAIGDSGNMNIKERRDVPFDIRLLGTRFYRDKRYKDYADELVSPREDLLESSVA
jgi:hypothetical protein